VRLIPGATDLIGSALMHIFSASDSLLPDAATHRVLEELIQHPQIMSCTEDGWLIERLESLLPHEPETVYRLCREIVKLRGRDLGSLQRGWAMHTANLTNIALTLHRLDSPYRGLGLELFEALLDIHLPDAEAALREMDLRPPGAGGQALPRLAARRHRRRRRATS
jgi:hypothetical protein